MLDSLLASIVLALAQKITVNGTVFSEEDSEPIQGATVLIKGTNIGTIADADGKFILSNVPSSVQTNSNSFYIKTLYFNVAFSKICVSFEITDHLYPILT